MTAAEGDDEGVIMLGTAALAARGVDNATAGECVRALVAAESDGVSSHGLIRIVEYCAALDSGELVADAEPAVESLDSTFVISGRCSIGTKTVRLVQQCLRSAVGAQHAVFVRVVSGSHLGRLSSVVTAAAADGLVVLGFANYSGTGQKVAVAGSGQGRLGTNPMVFACPAADGRPVVVDISTSAWSEGRVRVAAAQKVEVPDGVLVDRRGEPVNDPARLYARRAVDDVALAPLGTGPAGTDHKGYALAVMVELLGGALGGAAVCRETTFDGSGGNGALFLAFAPEILGHTVARLAEQVEALEKHVQRAQPLDLNRPVRLPGRSTSAERPTVNIPRSLVALLAKLGEGGHA